MSRSVVNTVCTWALFPVVGAPWHGGPWECFLPETMWYKMHRKRYNSRLVMSMRQSISRSSTCTL